MLRVQGSAAEAIANCVVISEAERAAAVAITTSLKAGVIEKVKIVLVYHLLQVL